MGIKREHKNLAKSSADEQGLKQTPRGIKDIRRKSAGVAHILLGGAGFATVVKIRERWPRLAELERNL